MYRTAQRLMSRCLRLQSLCSNTRHLNNLTGKDVARMRQIKAMVESKRAQGRSHKVVRGVVFDMDGTLTIPTLDFKEMRKRVGILEGDILEVIANMEEVQRKEVSRVLHEFEIEGLKDMQVMPGAADIAQFLDVHRVPRGLITRNVKESVAHFHSSVFPHKPFNPALARCFTPPKPSPAALLHICSQWGIQPHEVAMVGDSPADDMVCGNAAGAVTILIDSGRRYDAAALPAPHQPTHHVYSMHEVIDVLQQQCELSPPVAADTG